MKFRCILELLIVVLGTSTLETCRRCININKSILILLDIHCSATGCVDLDHWLDLRMSSDLGTRHTLIALSL